MQFWSGDNPVKASDGSDGQVRVVQQTAEGHSLSCAPVGVAEEIGGSNEVLAVRPPARPLEIQ